DIKSPVFCWGLEGVSTPSCDATLNLWESLGISGGISGESLHRISASQSGSQGLFWIPGPFLVNPRVNPRAFCSSCTFFRINAFINAFADVRRAQKTWGHSEVYRQPTKTCGLLASRISKHAGPERQAEL